MRPAWIGALRAGRSDRRIGLRLQGMPTCERHSMRILAMHELGGDGRKREEID